MTAPAAPSSSALASAPYAARLSRHMIETAWLLPAVAFAALTYYPITRNFFFADDFLNLYKIRNDPAFTYLVTPNGGHMLVTRNAVFYLTFHVFGISPEGYYWIAFLTHLLNVGLLYRLVRVATGDAPLASFGAALWGASPLSEGTLGWYAVYGQVLVATALLVILGQVHRLSDAHRPPSRAMRGGWYVLALIAATSFGTGIAVAVLLPFVLVLLLPEWRRRWWNPPLISLLVVLPVLYVVLNKLYARWAGDDILARTPWVALLADPVAIVSIWIKLLAYGLTRLLFGFYVPPGFGPPLWYVVAGTFAAVALVIAWRSPSALRRQLAAYLLLAVGCYGIIAAARAVLLLSIAPNFVTELPRYHYVGQLVLTVSLCLVLARAAAALPQRSKGVLVAAWYGLTLAAYLYLGPSIDHHDKARQDTHAALESMRWTIARAPKGKPIFIGNRAFASLPFPPAEFPGWAAVFVIFRPTNATVDGRPIYFVDGDPGVHAAAPRGKRTATLFVTPEQWEAARPAAAPNSP